MTAGNNENEDTRWVTETRQTGRNNDGTMTWAGTARNGEEAVLCLGTDATRRPYQKREKAQGTMRRSDRGVARDRPDRRAGP